MRIFPAFIYLSLSHVSAFSPSTHTSQRFGVRTLSNKRSIPSYQRLEHTTRLTDTTAQEVSTEEVPVSRILVCAGELCQCQGEKYEYTGGAADAAINELQSLGLPFPIEDVSCMGACGMGTMMFIDYENGDSIMTDGVESTLVELGIVSISVNENLSLGSGTGYKNIDSPNGVDISTSKLISETANVNVVEEKPKSILTQTPESKNKIPSSMLADTRERMRQEATAASEEVENPWIKMGSYLAKKAADKIFGSE